VAIRSAVSGLSVPNSDTGNLWNFPDILTVTVSISSMHSGVPSRFFDHDDSAAVRVQMVMKVVTFTSVV